MQTAKEMAKGIHLDANQLFDKHGEVPEGYIDIWESEILFHENEVMIETLESLKASCHPQAEKSMIWKIDRMIESLKE